MVNINTLSLNEYNKYIYRTDLTPEDFKDILEQ